MIGNIKLDLKTVVFGIVGLFVLFIALVLLGVIPGLKQQKTGPVIKGTITVWTANEGIDSGPIWSQMLNNFRAAYPDITVTTKDIDGDANYESALLDALGAGQGPDVFMVLNTGMPRYANKVLPATDLQFPLSSLRTLFPQVVEEDFAPQGKVYGLPLSMDTLAMIYNKNLLDQAAVPVPQTWEDFQNIIPKLTTVDTGKIVNAGAAIGTSAGNIGTASDLLQLIMLQNGTQMVRNDFSGAAFNTPQGINALTFYTQFADPSSQAYTWDPSQPNYLDSFTQGQTAIVFDYHSALQKIQTQNKFMTVGVAEMPNPAAQVQKNQKVNYARYYGLAVSRQTKSSDAAWAFVTFLTTNEDNAKNYSIATEKPPALRSLILQTKNDANFGVFSREALTALSWPQIDNHLVAQTFSQMIQKVNTNQETPQQAIEEGAGVISQAMQKKF